MEDCIFCRIANGEIPSYKIYEDGHTFAFFDINPKNEYHTLVITKKHYRNIFDVPADEAAYVMKAVKAVVDLLADKIGLENVQIISNAGECAQQEVPHLHFHVLPRYPGDGQNMKWPPPKTEAAGRLEELLNALE